MNRNIFIVLSLLFICFTHIKTEKIYETIDLNQVISDNISTIQEYHYKFRVLNVLKDNSLFIRLKTQYTSMKMTLYNSLDQSSPTSSVDTNNRNLGFIELEPQDIKESQYYYIDITCNDSLKDSCSFELQVQYHLIFELELNKIQHLSGGGKSHLQAFQFLVKKNTQSMIVLEGQYYFEITNLVLNKITFEENSKNIIVGEQLQTYYHGSQIYHVFDNLKEDTYFKAVADIPKFSTIDVLYKETGNQTKKQVVLEDNTKNYLDFTNTSQIDNIKDSDKKIYKINIDQVLIQENIQIIISNENVVNGYNDLLVDLLIQKNQQIDMENDIYYSQELKRDSVSFHLSKGQLQQIQGFKNTLYLSILCFKSQQNLCGPYTITFLYNDQYETIIPFVATKSVFKNNETLDHYKFQIQENEDSQVQIQMQTSGQMQLKDGQKFRPSLFVKQCDQDIINTCQITIEDIQKQEKEQTSLIESKWSQNMEIINLISKKIESDDKKLLNSFKNFQMVVLNQNYAPNTQYELKIIQEKQIGYLIDSYPQNIHFYNTNLKLFRYQIDPNALSVTKIQFQINIINGSKIMAQCQTTKFDDNISENFKQINKFSGNITYLKSEINDKILAGKVFYLQLQPEQANSEIVLTIELEHDEGKIKHATELQQLPVSVNLNNANEFYYFKFKSPETGLADLSINLTSKFGDYTIYVNNKENQDILKFENYQWKSTSNLKITSEDPNNKIDNWFYGIVVPKKVEGDSPQQDNYQFIIQFIKGYQHVQLVSGLPLTENVLQNEVRLYQIKINEKDNQLQFTQKATNWNLKQSFHCKFIIGNKDDKPQDDIFEKESLNLNNVSQYCDYTKNEFCYFTAECNSQVDTKITVLVVKNQDPVRLTDNTFLHMQMPVQNDQAVHFFYEINKNQKQLAFYEKSEEFKSMMYGKLFIRNSQSDFDIHADKFKYPIKSNNNAGEVVLTGNKIIVQNLEENCSKAQFGCVYLVSVYLNETVKDSDLPQLQKSQFEIEAFTAGQQIVEGVIQLNNIEKEEYQYFNIFLQEGKKVFSISAVSVDQKAEVGLVIKKGRNSYPDIVNNYDWIDNEAKSSNQIIIDPSSKYENDISDYYTIGVYGRKKGKYQLSYHTGFQKLIDFSSVHYHQIQLSQNHPIYIIYKLESNDSFKILTSSQGQGLNIKGKILEQSEYELIINDEIVDFQFNSTIQKIQNYLEIKKTDKNYCYQCQYIFRLESSENLNIFVNILLEDSQNLLPDNKLIQDYLQRKNDISKFKFIEGLFKVRIHIIQGNVQLEIENQILTENNNQFIQYNYSNSNPNNEFALFQVRAIEPYSSYNIQVTAYSDILLLETGIPYHTTIFYGSIDQFEYQYHFNDKSIPQEQQQPGLISYNLIIKSQGESSQLTTEIFKINDTVEFYGKKLSGENTKYVKIYPDIVQKTKFTFSFEISGAQYQKFKLIIKNESSLNKSNEPLFLDVLVEDETVMTYLYPSQVLIHSLQKKGSNYYQIIPPQKSRILLQIYQCKGEIVVMKSDNQFNLQRGIGTYLQQYKSINHYASSFIVDQHDMFFIRVTDLYQNEATYHIHTEYYPIVSQNPYDYFSLPHSNIHSELTDKSIIFIATALTCIDCNNIPFKIESVNYTILLAYDDADALQQKARCEFDNQFKPYNDENKPIVLNDSKDESQERRCLVDDNKVKSITKSFDLSVVKEDREPFIFTIPEKDLPEFFDPTNMDVNALYYTAVAQIKGTDLAINKDNQKVVFNYDIQEILKFNSINDVNKTSSGWYYLLGFGIFFYIVLMAFLGYTWYKKKQAENRLTYSVEDVRNVAKVTDGIELSSNNQQSFMQFNDDKITDDQINSL